MPVTLVQAKVSNSGAGTTQDWLDAGISSVKGYLLASNSGATVDTVRNHATLSIGISDGTDEYCFSCFSFNRSLSADATVAYHKGRTGDSLSIYDESSTPGDRLVLGLNSFQATGVRLDIDLMDSTATGDRPQTSMAIFHGTSQNVKVGKVMSSGSNQDIDTVFQPKAMLVFCLNSGEDFDNTNHDDGMVAMGMVAWNNAGTEIATQHSLTHNEPTGQPASIADYFDLAGACFQDIDGAQFNAVEYIANGFRVPAGSPTFIYIAWDWPTTGHSDVRLTDQVAPAATGAFNIGVGHTSEFAIGLYTGLDPAAWGEGRTGVFQTGQLTLFLATAAAQNSIAYSLDPGNVIPITKCVFTDAAGVDDRALGILIEGAGTGTLDAARGAIASHTAHLSTKIEMSLDAQPFTLGNRGIMLSCGRDPIRASILKAKIRKAKIR